MNNPRDISRLIVETHGPTEEFCPSPSEPCFCGSGKSFSQCCGSTELVRPPPFGLFMFEKFVDKEYCKDLVDFADQRPGQPLMVIDSEASTPDNIVKVADPRRVTECVNLDERRQEINKLVEEIFVKLADECLGKKLDWYETPELMRYREGGMYMSHADSENMDHKTRQWSKAIDRDLSLLIYLNEDFEGGELSFYQFNYQVWPRTGGVVMFPSDHRYQHQAEKVIKGVRYAIVSWASVHGIPKIAAQPPKSAIMVG